MTFLLNNQIYAIEQGVNIKGFNIVYYTHYCIITD